MGSATFALPTLRGLFEKGYEIAGVITQPDKPGGRGQELQEPPVKKAAFDLHLPIYQPRSLKNDETRALFEALAPQMIVVVAYGKILPSWLLKLPSYGCINLHGSLLPKYRGAAPVHWAIANGRRKREFAPYSSMKDWTPGPSFSVKRRPLDLRRPYSQCTIVLE